MAGLVICGRAGNYDDAYDVELCNEHRGAADSARDQAHPYARNRTPDDCHG
jgi:hypothetical protein